MGEKWAFEGRFGMKQEMGIIMSRPPKKRRICKIPSFQRFNPEKVKSEETVILEVDEYESIRLIDYEGLTQEECAKQMNLIRTSVQAIYAQARRKLADSLVNGKRLEIRGGAYVVCEGDRQECIIRHRAGDQCVREDAPKQ